MTAGRPTKLTPELMAKAKEYVEGGFLAKELVPTIAGLTLHIDVRRSTVYEWAKSNEQFSDIVDKVMVFQEQELIRGSLGGALNASIAKLLLTKHGYSDKQETALTGADGGPVEVRDVTRTIIDPKH